MGDLDEIVKEFLVESYENLDQLDRDFVALETNPTAIDQLGSIFRTIHTIKGTCGCLGLHKLESVAHVGENLLSRLRDGQLIMDTEIATGLLKLVDAIREILASIETAGHEGDKEYVEIRENLIRLNARPSNKRPAAPAASALKVPAPAPVAHSTIAPPPPPPPTSAPAAMKIDDRALVVPEPETTAGVNETTPEASAANNGEPAAKESVAGNVIRVDVVLLDKLMNLVGELVLARNQVLQHTAGQKDVALLRTAQRLNLITSELQEGVMKTRMQPIGNLWNKFPRVVRDVANACGKKVRIEMEGRETELDKTILEAIKDPLTHVIRNSVDHGVENPERRIKAGKPEEGVLFMRAFHEGGQVNIEIKDDGKGIDTEVVKRKALDKGLITAEQAARMGEREATNLVFLPGFSTAEKITNVSGRGVGMDVVKTNIERIGGTVDIKSRVGEGTTLRIRIPLTLAIIPALVVTSGVERFAIPQVSLLALVRVEEGGIEMIKETPVYRLRGNLLPLVYLNRELKIEPIAGVKTDNAANIVVLRGGERQFGLVVDQINDTEEIVVKPLGKQLKGLSVFAGTTIMGDGKVALILDVMGLAQRANVISHTVEGAVHGSGELARDNANDKQTLLLCMLGGGQRAAIKLSLVARLEEFQPSVVEDAGGQPVVQYRGEIMPLINVGQVLHGGGGAEIFQKFEVRNLEASNEVRSTKSQIPNQDICQRRVSPDARSIQVVVYRHKNRNVGLCVEKILDVVEERVDLQRTAMRSGVLGTAIIKEKVTELLDVPAIVRDTIGSDLHASELQEAA